MKKILSLFMLLIMIACSSPKENIISNVTSTIGKEPTKVEGNVYTYSDLTEKNLYKDYKTIKENIDKELGCLPIETNEKDVSAATGELYTSYKWETSNIYVVLWVDYKEGSEFIQMTIREK